MHLCAGSEQEGSGGASREQPSVQAGDMYLRSATCRVRPAGMRGIRSDQYQEVARRRGMQVLGSDVYPSPILECNSDDNASALGQHLLGAPAPILCLAPLDPGAACTVPWAGG